MAAATVVAVASGPLATIAYRGGSRAALLGRAAATAAAPAALYAWGPANFTARALAPAVSSAGAGATLEPLNVSYHVGAARRVGKLWVWARNTSRREAGDLAPAVEVPLTRRPAALRNSPGHG